MSRHSSDYDGKSVDVGAVVETAAVQVDMMTVMVVVVGSVGRRGGGPLLMLLLRLLMKLLLLLLLLQVMMPSLLLVRVVGGRHGVARLAAAARVLVGRGRGGHPDVLDGVGHGDVGGGRVCGGGGGRVSGARSPRGAERKKRRGKRVESS